MSYELTELMTAMQRLNRFGQQDNPLNMMMQLTELQAAMENYRGHLEQLRAESPNWRLVVLEELKPFLDPYRQRQLELFIQIMELNRNWL